MAQTHTIEILPVRLNGLVSCCSLTIAAGLSIFRQWICLQLHKKSRPWKDENGLYQRCLDCGRRIPWSDPQLVHDIFLVSQR
jgi:hypothetical protein